MPSINPASGNAPGLPAVLPRRSFLAALAPLGALVVTSPAIARPAPSFEARAEEIAELMRQHFRPTLPKGVERYAIIIQDAPGIPLGPHECRLSGRAGMLDWFPLSGGWR